MMRIYAVAANTYREAIRDKVLYVLLFFAAATILSSKLLGYISVGEDQKVIVDISLTAISVFGALIAIFVGTNLVYKEIDKRTVYTILATPIWRFEFIVGKFLGLMALLAVVCAATGAVAGLYIVLSGGAVTPALAVAVLLIYMKLMLVTAVSILLSTVTSPILGALVVFSFYVFGHATGVLVDLPGTISNSTVKTILEWVYYVLPNLANFDIRSEVANRVPVDVGYIEWTALYGILWTGLFLVLAALAFERKDV